MSRNDMMSIYSAVMGSTMVQNLVDENKKLKREIRALKNVLYAIPEFRCKCSKKPRKLRTSSDVVIKQEKSGNFKETLVVDFTQEEAVVKPSVALEAESDLGEKIKEEEEVEEEEVEEEEVEEEEVDEGKELQKGLERMEESITEEEVEVEEEEEEEEEVEEENVQMEISEPAQEKTADPEEEEEEEGEEAEVFEIEIGGVTYFTEDEVNGTIYAKTDDEDIGDELGVFVNGKPKFHKK
jgi:hypothetical protein